jgi:hypothetical protein
LAGSGDFAGGAIFFDFGALGRLGNIVVPPGRLSSAWGRAGAVFAASLIDSGLPPRGGWTAQTVFLSPPWDLPCHA